MLVSAAITIWSQTAFSYVHFNHVNKYHHPNSKDRKVGTCPSRLSAAQVNEELPTTINGQKTLYAILNSTPDASRSDLKRNYISLVRKTHPDALLSRGEPALNDDNPEFQEIMQAWRTLSNPFERKRYDRTLRAAAFTAKVENVVGKIGKTAGPQFMNAFENVAIPFLRRSAATTVAGFTSISQDLANYGSNENSKKTEETGLSGIISNAFKSSQKAGKAIDCLELMEKSRDLKKRYYIFY